MNSMATRVACVALIAVTIVSASVYAAENPPEEGLPSPKELPAACRAAKADFRPLTAEDVQQAKTQLLADLKNLDRKLAADGRNGESWRTYLQWDKLRAQLNSDDGGDLDVLKSIYERFAADQQGLELVWFRNAAEALWRYRFLAASVDNEKLKPAYEQLLDSLAKHLEQYAARPTAENALQIGNAVGQLQDARQAPQVVNAVAHHFRRPNMLMQASADIITAALNDEVDYTEPFTDYILGTHIRGTGHTVGQVTAELIPDDKRGVVDMTFLGITESKNIGSNGPVQIHSNSATRIGARKRLWVDAKGFHALPASANAASESEINSIRGSAMAQRIASQRVTQQKGRAEQIAAQHAEQRAARRIDRRAAEAIARANDSYVAKIRRPLVDRKLFPQRFDFSSTAETLRLVGLQADYCQLGAPRPAPLKPNNKADLSLRMHESAINNLAASAWAGRTVSDKRIEAALVNLLGEVPEQLQDDEDQQPWAITFADEEPITLAFAGNKGVLTIRGRKYRRGDESYPGMNVTVVYQFTKTGRQFKAVRQGKLQINPPGFISGKGEKLSSRQVVIRKLLDRRFGRIFKPEILIEDLELPDRWSKVGKLRPVELVAKDAWLAISWQRVAE